VSSDLFENTGPDLGVFDWLNKTPQISGHHILRSGYSASGHFSTSPSISVVQSKNLQRRHSRTANPLLPKLFYGSNHKYCSKLPKYFYDHKYCSKCKLCTDTDRRRGIFSLFIL